MKDYEDDEITFPVINKRNIGSVSRHWRPKVKGFTKSQSRMRSFRDTTRTRSNNDVIFFRSYRDGLGGPGEVNQVYVDLRTEALMRGMG